VHINWWTLALQTINVLVLVWLLSRFLYQPIVAAIAERQAAADKLLADAGAAQAAGTASAAKLKASTDAFAADTARRRAEMQAGADADRTRLLDQARQEVADLHKQAESAAVEERKQAGAALELQAATLAGQMAGKLLDRLPAAATTGAMFQALVDRLATLPDVDRGRLATGALTVVTPEPLGDPDRLRYGQALAAALPGLAAPDFTDEPGLIAGFELRNPYIVLRNSWRADLDELLHALQEDAHARIG
jgi:F-type H+-transporting ATPase subunit b